MSPRLLSLFLIMIFAPSLCAAEPSTDFASLGQGTLIVLNKGEASASLISLESGRVTGTFPTGRGPHEAAVSPDGRMVVIGDYGQRRPGFTLTLFDLTLGTHLGEIVLRPYKRPHGIVFLDPTTVIVTAETNKSLIVVDLEKKEIVRAIDTKAEISHMVALHSTLRRAFVANIGSGTVSVIDLEKGENIGFVATGEGAEGIDVSPDGREVWVTNRTANTLSIFDPKSLEIRDTIPCKEFPIRAKFTPDGLRVLISCAGTGDVQVFDVAKRTLIRSISMEAKATEDKSDRLFGDRFGDSPVPVGILIPPDGKFAFVANTNADVISVIDLETLQLKTRLVAGKEPDGLAYSPLPPPTLQEQG